MDDKRLRAELIISIVIMVVSIFAIVVAASWEDPMASDYPTLRSTFIPMLWASFLGGLGFIYFLSVLLRIKRIQTSRFSKKETNTSSTLNHRKIAVATILTGIALITYCYLLKKVNFLLLTIGFLFVLFTIYEGIRKWLINLAIAVVSGIAVYILFVIFMQIPL